MRRFATIVLACVIGLAAAFAFAYVAGLLHPCQGERLSCSMTEIVGLIYTPVFSAVALICFTIAVFWKPGVRALNIALLIPLVPFLLLAAGLKYSDISVREFHEIREGDIREMLWIVIPIILTLILPWAVLLRFAKWLEPKRNPNG